MKRTNRGEIIEEGLRVVRAFFELERRSDRQQVIDLVERLRDAQLRLVVNNP